MSADMFPKLSLSIKKEKHSSRSRRRWRPWLKWGSIVLGIIVVMILLVSAYYYPKAKAAMAAGRHAQTVAKKISADLTQQKFTQAQTDIKALQVDLQET